jgi:hypothetical protein
MACVAIVMMAVPITMPASQESPGRGGGGGGLPEVLYRCIAVTFRSGDIVIVSSDCKTASGADWSHGHVGRLGQVFPHLEPCPR